MSKFKVADGAASDSLSISSLQPGYEPQNTLEVPTPKEQEETASEAPSAKPGKKISSATKKRLEAQKAKEATPQKKDNKPKPKAKSIFNRKANPAFFNKEEAKDEEVEILLSDANVHLNQPKDPQESVVKESSAEKIADKSVKEDPAPQKPKPK